MMFIIFRMKILLLFPCTWIDCFMSNTENKTKKRNISGSVIAGIGCIAAICFCVLFVIIRGTGVGAASESPDAKNGAEYISGIEKRDVKELSERIGKASKSRKLDSAKEKLTALDNEETDIWNLFDGIVIVGDSRSEAFVEYDYLPESVVVAKKGANLKYADEVIDDVVSKQPDSIIFTYGINDVTGNWISPEPFIERYKYIISEYKKQLPDADIFVCSIIPVYEKAIEDDPTLIALPEYAEAVREMCDEEGYIFMDCDDIYDYKEYYEDEGMHFKSPMYPIWGRMMLRKVFEYESQQLTENND